MLNKVDIKPYLDFQINAEEKYYKELQPIIIGLLVALLDATDNKITNFVTLQGIVNTYQTQNANRISQLNRQQALTITNIANNAMGNIPKNQPHNIGSFTADNLQSQLNVLTNYLLGNTSNRVFNMIPLGLVGGLYTGFFTDETTREDIFRRTNNSVMEFVRDCYTQATINTMLSTLAKNGYSEYLADNKHDDKVRPLHKKYFQADNWISFSNPPECGHVGTQNNCRCYIVAVR